MGTPESEALIDRIVRRFTLQRVRQITRNGRIPDTFYITIDEWLAICELLGGTPNGEMLFYGVPVEVTWLDHHALEAEA